MPVRFLPFPRILLIFPINDQWFVTLFYRNSNHKLGNITKPYVSIYNSIPCEIAKGRPCNRKGLFGSSIAPAQHTFPFLRSTCSGEASKWSVLAQGVKDSSRAPGLLVFKRPCGSASGIILGLLWHTTTSFRFLESDGLVFETLATKCIDQDCQMFQFQFRSELGSSPWPPFRLWKVTGLRVLLLTH